MRMEKEKAQVLGFQKTGGNVVVAVKLDIIKGGGDAKPAGHGGGLRSAHMRHGGDDDVAESQRPADQDDFQFDRGADREWAGTKKIDPGGADIASDKGDRSFLGHSPGTAKAQRQVQSGARIFPMLWMYANGVCGHPDETARLGRYGKRHHAQCRDARHIRDGLGAQSRFARFRSEVSWPGFEWSYTFRRAHLALRDGTTLSLAMAQQTRLPK